MSEYQEMYLECCIESGEKPTFAGLVRFTDWRKRVEVLFDERKNNEFTKPSAKYA